MTKTLIQLMRPTDWLKNVLVFAALVFREKLLDPTAAVQAALAFVAFCLMSSGFYAINDAADAEQDRLHPIKRKRPVASGAISARSAVWFGVALVVPGVALGFAVAPLLGTVCLLYVLVQVLYNARLKRVLLVDVVAIAIGFVLRAAAGAAAIDIRISMWLALCVFFLCLYLGFIKRLSDLASAEARNETQWKPPAGYSDRHQLSWMLAVSAALAVMTYLMYALSEHVEQLFGARSLGFPVLSPLVIIVFYRFYLRADRGYSDRPIDALIEDRAIRASVILFAVGVVASLYLPVVGRALGRYFIK